MNKETKTKIIREDFEKLFLRQNQSTDLKSF